MCTIENPAAENISASKNSSSVKENPPMANSIQENGHISKMEELSMEKFSTGKTSALKPQTTQKSSALKTLLTQSPQLEKLFKDPDSENYSEPPNMKNLCNVSDLESLGIWNPLAKLSQSPESENPTKELEKVPNSSNIIKDTNTSELEKDKNTSDPEKLSHLSELEKIENSHALTCNNPGACITMCAITYTLARKKTLAAKRQRRAAVVVPACFTNDDPSSGHDRHFNQDKQLRALDKLRKSICMTKLVIGTFEMKDSGKFDQFLVAIGTKRRTVNMVNRAAVKICIKQDPDNRWTIMQETTVKAKSSYFGNTKIRKTTLNKFRPKSPCMEMVEDYDTRMLETTLVVEGGNRLILMQEDNGNKALSSTVCLSVSPSHPDTLVVTHLVGEVVAERVFTRVMADSPEVILPPQPVLMKSDMGPPMEMGKLSSRGL